MKVKEFFQRQLTLRANVVGQVENLISLMLVVAFYTLTDFGGSYRWRVAAVVGHTLAGLFVAGLVVYSAWKGSSEEGDFEIADHPRFDKSISIGLGLYLNLIKSRGQPFWMMVIVVGALQVVMGLALGLIQLLVWITSGIVPTFIFLRMLFTIAVEWVVPFAIAHHDALLVIGALGACALAVILKLQLQRARWQLKELDEKHKFLHGLFEGTSDSHIELMNSRTKWAMTLSRLHYLLRPPVGHAYKRDDVNSTAFELEAMVRGMLKPAEADAVMNVALQAAMAKEKEKRAARQKAEIPHVIQVG